MLVLSRNEEEVLWIGDVSLKILDVRHDHRVRLGIEAPKGIPILRGELRSKSTGKLAFIPEHLLAKLPRILSYVAESPAGSPEADCAELCRVILGQVNQ